MATLNLRHIWFLSQSATTDTLVVGSSGLYTAICMIIVMIDVFCQMTLEDHKPGATVIPLIVSTDRTQVTLFGNKTAYPMYLTIGNLPKEIRAKPSRCSQILLAYLPTSKLKLITNQAARWRMITNLFHACLHRIMKPLVDVGIHGIAMKDGTGTV